jgi:pyruvate dehydrogenase (quinone)
VAAVLDELMADDAIVASMASASPNAFGASLAYPGRQVVALCGDGGFSMLALGDLITEVQRGARIVHVIFDNSRLDFVDIEQQEAGLVPFGTDLPNPDFAKVATAKGFTLILLKRARHGDIGGVLHEATDNIGLL